MRRRSQRHKRNHCICDCVLRGVNNSSISSRRPRKRNPCQGPSSGVPRPGAVARRLAPANGMAGAVHCHFQVLSDFIIWSMRLVSARALVGV